MIASIWRTTSGVSLSATSSAFRFACNWLIFDAPVITDEELDGLEVAIFGLGCFWGAEEVYWQLPGVWSTSVGYAGGTTPNQDLASAGVIATVIGSPILA